MAIHAGWYAKNQVRSYPFAFSATMENTRGQTLPDGLLADLSLRFVGDKDSRLFMSYVLITDEVVAIALSRTQPDTRTVATFTAPRSEVVPGEMYKLQPTEYGESGMVVFGDLSNIPNDHWQFETSVQTGMARNTYMSTYKPPQGRFGFIGRTNLLDSMTLAPGGDLTIRNQVYPVDGIPRECVVIGLADDPDDPDRDVLAEYAGNCGKRPESGTCDDPQPIERINDVGPDCCGRVFVEFRGCASMTEIANHCGVVIDCATQVDDICGISYKVPDANGMLPFEFPDRLPPPNVDPDGLCELDDCSVQLFYFSGQNSNGSSSLNSTTT